MDDLEVRPGLVIPASELSFTSSRASGPGGQHVNKVSTRVTLRWNVAETTVLDGDGRRRVMERLATRIGRSGILSVHAGRERSQAANLRAARTRLAGLVGEALRADAPRIPTRPSAASRRRRLDEKRKTSQIKRLRRDPGREE
jgi:ribosome-associated protein